MSVAFEERDHTYRNAVGNQVPSVTGLIKRAGLYPPGESFWSEDAMLRGTVVHVATSLIDREGEQELPGLSEEWMGYVDAWRLFKREAKFDVELIEQVVHSEDWNYAGIVDRTGRFNGGPLAVVDIKTGAPHPWHAIQTAGYMIALQEMANSRADELGQWTAFPSERYTVYLNAGGGYKVKEHTDLEDEDIFKAACAIASWKEKYENDDSSRDSD